MPELPEIMILSRQMSDELASREFESIDVVQEKCLNMRKDDFVRELVGRQVIRAYSRGKWVFIQLSEKHHLLLNLGMGADVLYYPPGKDWPEKYQCRFHFTDQSGFTCRFSWIGRVELVPDDELSQHRRTKDTAISPLDPGFTRDHFRALSRGRRRTKNLLTDQRKIGGIGNVYIHDILFRAGIHPLRPVNTLSLDQIDSLAEIMREYLEESVKKNGLTYERDFYGKVGGFSGADFSVAYKEGQPCPVCGTAIEKIKTGSTSSYICSQCQRL